MDLITTLGLTAAAGGFGAFCAWRGAQPWNPAKGPRLVPYRGLMLLSAAVALMLVVHLVNLAGIRTGR